MKAKIHPNVHTDAKVSCSSCGNAFTTTSVKPEIRVEVCSKCHPFYTGEHRFLDTKGRVEEFQKRQKVAAEYKVKYQQTKKAKKDAKQEQDSPKSLKELLGAV